MFIDLNWCIYIYISVPDRYIEIFVVTYKYIMYKSFNGYIMIT